MVMKSVLISNLRRTLKKLHEGFQTETGAQSVGDRAMTENATAQTAPVVEKQSIDQKVAILNSEKAAITSSLNTMAEGPEKVAAQERIAVIDRKVRWYAGRTGGKGTRPSKAAKAPKAPKAAKTPTAPVAPAANAS